MPVPRAAKLGKDVFDKIATASGNSTPGMRIKAQTNPLTTPFLVEFWAAWELTDRPRKPVLLVDDMQEEYRAYMGGILPRVRLLVDAFRKANLPIFWSSWYRFGPDDGYFNSMDRFYGPWGWKTEFNALYLHNREHGADVLDEIAPVTEEERRRVMLKSYSLSMFDEQPMKWLLPSGQGTLHEELQELGVDTVVQVGAWSEDCIVATAFQAFQLQYDVVVVEDAITTATPNHFAALQVMKGSVAKVAPASAVAEYISQGMPVKEPREDFAHAQSPSSLEEVGATAAAEAAQQAAAAPQALSAELVAAALAASASSQGQQWHQQLLLAFTGPACFAAGWLLRGKVSSRREALLLQ